MRGLALRLVGDDAAADDLVQETFVRALERPPRHLRATGSWLRTSLTRFASRRRLEESRRRRRERAVARDVPLPSSDEDVERVELHRSVVELVLELEPAERTVIILRFFDGVSAVEIAERVGVDESTVRRRVRAALETLRRGLARRYGISYAALPVLLLPLVRASGPLDAAVASATSVSPTAAQGSSAVVASVPKSLGIYVMNAKAIALSVSVLVLLTLGFLILSNRSAAPPTIESPNLTDVGGGDENAVSTEGLAIETERDATESGTRPSGTVAPPRVLQVLMRWEGSGTPVVGATLTPRVPGFDADAGSVSEGAMSNAEGIAHLVPPPGWGGALSVEHPNAHPRDAEVPLSPTGPYVIELVAVHSVVGVISDNETGDAIVGATVEVGDQESRTDDEGVFVVDDVTSGIHTVTAQHEHFASAAVSVRTKADGGAVQCDFALDPAVSIHVHVADENGSAIGGADVSTSDLKEGFHSNLGITDADGVVVVTGMSRLKTPRFTAEKEGYRFVRTSQVRRDVIELDVTRRQGRVELVLAETNNPTRILTGVIRDESTRPIEDVSVEWMPTLGVQSSAGEVRTDSAGRYEIAFESSESTCHLGVHKPGWGATIVERAKAGTRESPGVLDLTLTRGHWLEGTVVDEQGEPLEGIQLHVKPEVGVGRVNFSSVLRAAKTDSKGHFRVEDITGPRVAVHYWGRVDGRKMASGTGYHAVDSKVTITLKELGVVRGRVVDRETGEPIPVFRIHLTDGDRIAVRRINQGEAFTSDDGAFVLKDLRRSGTCSFTVKSDGYSDRQVENVWPRLESDASSTTVELYPERTFVISVVDEKSQQPLAGVKVKAAFWNDRRAFHNVAEARWENLERLPGFERHLTDNTGQVRLDEGEPRWLFLEADGYAKRVVGPRDREALRNGPQGIVVPLGQGVPLAGKVSIPEPLRREEQIWLRRVIEPSAAGRRRRLHFGPVKVATDGTFHFERAAPGEYELDFGYRDSADAAVTWASRRVGVGKTSEALVLGRRLGELSYTVHLKVPEGREFRFARLRLVPAGDKAHSGFLVHDGDVPELVARRLPKGRYDVELVVAIDQNQYTPTLPRLQLVGDDETTVELPARGETLQR